MKISLRQWVLMALFTGLSIVLTRILSIRVPIGGIEGIRIGFGGLPLVLAGVMFGPFAGGMVGALSDMVGYFINPLGPYMPHFTLTSALNGVIPPLILRLKDSQDYGWVELTLAVFVGRLIASTLLVPYFLLVLFRLPLAITLPPKVISLILEVPCYVILIHEIVRRVPLSAEFSPLLKRLKIGR